MHTDGMNETNQTATDGGLPAYEVIYADGSSYITSMSKVTTLEKARAYFIDASIEQSDGSCKRVADVKAANTVAARMCEVPLKSVTGEPRAVNAAPREFNVKSKTGAVMHVYAESVSEASEIAKRAGLDVALCFEVESEKA